MQISFALALRSPPTFFTPPPVPPPAWEFLGRWGQSCDPGQRFAFQKLQTCSTAGADVTNFILRIPFRATSRRVAAADDRRGALRRRFDHCVHYRFCSFGEIFPFKNTDRSENRAKFSNFECKNLFKNV